MNRRRNAVYDARVSGLTRRDFLVSLVGALIAVGVPGCAPRYREPAWLERILHDRAAAARLGQIYLDAHPEERDPEALVDAIEGTTGDLPADPLQAGMRLQTLVRDDYTRDNVVPVSGWVLSRTEARLYALSAAAGPPVTP